ncbi:telomere repeat-binding protein 5-like [Silene latifolia]|uniref:telomere repeat-binding protein 5-like n=1 Tax=Silene latifolia TaxID=37657 RepID=UPI003D7895D6
MQQKRLDYGFSGYHVPFVPRAARSTRRRGLVQKKVEDNQLCAFDLLATVAGKILLEGEGSHETVPVTDLSNVKDVAMDVDNNDIRSLVVEHCDRGGLEPASPPLTLELGIRGFNQDLNVKETPIPTPNTSVGLTSVLPVSDCLEKNGPLAMIDLNGAFGCHIEPRVPLVAEDAKCCVQEGDRLFGNGPSIEDPEILDEKSPTLVSSDASVKLTLGNDHYPCSSQSPCRDNNNVNVVSRDDDENSSECIQPSTKKTARSTACIGDRRIRKLLESKYRRIASRARDGDLTDSEVRCMFSSRKTGFKRQRSQRIYPFKRRRFYHHSSSSHADISYNKSVYNYPDKAVDANASGFGSMGVNGSSACVGGQSTTFSSRESRVKLRIKSFRVPELFIEMPETASIGSLKRTVMEAVSALLGGGLRVGVFLQGKKIRDDNRTLVQSGICHDNKAESLGFSLEPNPSQVRVPACSEDNSLIVSPDVPQPISRCPLTTPVQQGTSNLLADHLATNLANVIESDHDSTPSPADISAEKVTVDSCALVALPGGTPQALSVVHSHPKPKRSDMGQRRIRRPFSVTEVEALVHAVEKLGTGRWRDVKLRAFDNVKHRTYVDLKDKWKTLVHTARIAPQQRRGEPVPQDLLDRVLAAHSYWTQHQSKQPPPPPPPSETRLLL